MLQDLGKYFRLNGAIYICKTTKLIEEKTFFLKNNCKAFVMRQENSLDIDNQIDLDFGCSHPGNSLSLLRI